MAHQAKDRRSTCSCGTLQDRRGFEVWRLLSSEMRWVSSSSSTSQTSKVSSTSDTGWVSYRSMHTVKIRTSFCVGTNVTCRTREWSVKTRLVNSPRSTESRILRRVLQTGITWARPWKSCWISSWRGWNDVWTSPGSPMGLSELTDPSPQTSQRAPTEADVHVRFILNICVHSVGGKWWRGGSLYIIIIIIIVCSVMIICAIQPVCYTFPSSLSVLS